MTPQLTGPEAPARNEQQPSLGVHDLLFTVFRHKKLVLICALLGIIAAAAVYLLYPIWSPPTYQSRAKLFVRYVVERSAVDGVDNTGLTPRNNLGGNASIGSEVEILTSWDLAQQVAEVIGAKRLLPNATDTPSAAEAASVVIAGLRVGVNGNILFVSYEHRDPQIARQVLEELINRYFSKHLEVHRSAGAFDFVTQQTDQVRARLNQTEDALKPLNEQTGILSLADGRSALSAELSTTFRELRDTEIELVVQMARIQALGGKLPEAAASPAPPSAAAANGAAAAPAVASPASTETAAADTEDPLNSEPAVDSPSEPEIEQYRGIVTRLAQMKQRKVELLNTYTEHSSRVQMLQKQIDELDRERLQLERRFPQLAVRAPTDKGGDLASEYARLAGLSAKVQGLRYRLGEAQSRAKQLRDLGPQIAELERKREVEEANYKYFQSTLDKTRVDEALDPSKMPNITAVQRPTIPTIVPTQRGGLALKLAGGGIALGVALAFALDILLDRTVKRRVELERRLHVPLLMSIPYFNGNARYLKNGSHKGGDGGPSQNGSGGAAIAPWSPGHFIRPYCEAIRDRISLYFELNNLTHKPKLVGVTSLSSTAGTSTVAAGLASALSESHEGKVLLVDATLGPQDVHPFFDGKPAYSLAAALQPSMHIDPAAENLYLATVGSAQVGPAQLGIKKFFEMMPNLKASDFDYIIFDMPPLEQISPSWGMAPFMDKLLLIVEAEKVNRDVVDRGYNRLLAGRDNISVLFNKARSYGPRWAQVDE